MRPLLFSIAAFLALSCASNAQSPPTKLSYGGRAVRVVTGDPPAGARELGPITGEDGDYCDVLDALKGTYSHAVVRLRNRAAARGGNYVEVLTMTQPHQESMRCFDNRFVIRGMLYDVPGASSDVGAGQADSDACNPPCSPGYKCDEGACEPVCNPECPANQVCRPDRTCGPPS